MSPASVSITADVGRQVWSAMSSQTRTVRPVGSSISAHHAEAWNQSLFWFSARVGDGASGAWMGTPVIGSTAAVGDDGAIGPVGTGAAVGTPGSGAWSVTGSAL